MRNKKTIVEQPAIAFISNQVFFNYLTFIFSSINQYFLISTYITLIIPPITAAITVFKEVLGPVLAVGATGADGSWILLFMDVRYSFTKVLLLTMLVFISFNSFKYFFITFILSLNFLIDKNSILESIDIIRQKVYTYI